MMPILLQFQAGYKVVTNAWQATRATHEPERRAPARRGVACPERADLEIGAPSPRFMVPMRGSKVVGAPHEPWLVWSPAFRRLERLGPAEAGTPSCQRFKVPMRGSKVVEATH